MHGGGYEGRHAHGLSIKNTDARAYAHGLGSRANGETNKTYTHREANKTCTHTHMGKYTPVIVTHNGNMRTFVGLWFTARSTFRKQMSAERVSRQVSTKAETVRSSLLQIIH